jgi:membrane protease YdiL (CAAX protease family)
MERDRSLLARISNDYPVAVFAALAIGVSWTVWIATFSVTAPRSGLGLLGISLGAFGPGIAGAIVTRLRGESIRSWLVTTLDWRRRLRWYGLAIAVPVGGAVGMAALVFSLAGMPDTDSFARLAPLVAVNLVLATLLTGGNEELGWRGFALPELQTRFSALTASLLLGGVWAVWHVPMFVYGVYQLSPLLYAASVISFSVILTWYYNTSAGCVPGAMLLHGTLNAVVNVPGQAIGGADTLPVPYAAILAGVFTVLAGLLVIRYGAATLSPGDTVHPRWRRTGPADETMSAHMPRGPHTTDPSE